MHGGSYYRRGWRVWTATPSPFAAGPAHHRHTLLTPASCLSPFLKLPDSYTPRGLGDKNVCCSMFALYPLSGRNSLPSPIPTICFCVVSSSRLAGRRNSKVRRYRKGYNYGFLPSDHQTIYRCDSASFFQCPSPFLSPPYANPSHIPTFPSSVTLSNNGMHKRRAHTHTELAREEVRHPFLVLVSLDLRFVPVSVTS